MSIHILCQCHNCISSFRCCICLLQYDNHNTRLPVCLPQCGHSFCRSCLIKVQDDKGCQFPCPTCRMKHDGKSVMKIPVNYSLCNAIGKCNIEKKSVDIQQSIISSSEITTPKCYLPSAPEINQVDLITIPQADIISSSSLFSGYWESADFIVYYGEHVPEITRSNDCNQGEYVHTIQEPIEISHNISRNRHHEKMKRLQRKLGELLRNGIVRVYVLMS
ncbi:unnamed protein product [Meganyctiphanes norvegica]|uniref:RING-type domain-containing protein n=1 Tax=Meganyctiphanes norvegica TaxID=48144 RepID=A0AAV2Q3Z6_MEGNR